MLFSPLGFRGSVWTAGLLTTRTYGHLLGRFSNAFFLEGSQCFSCGAWRYLAGVANPAVAMIDSVDSLDPLSARWARGEGVTEVLRLAGYRPILEFHNADYVIRLLVVLEDKFADPKVSTAEDASHGEAFRIRLGFARRLNVGPATDALARLRIFENCISSVDFVFRVEVVGVGCFPVALQTGPYVVVTHGDSPSVTRLHRRCDQDRTARSIIRHEGIIRR
jgi:hypothetical protein